MQLIQNIITMMKMNFGCKRKHEQTFSGNNSEKQPPLVKSPEQLNDRCEVNLGCDGEITVKQAGVVIAYNNT